MPPFSNFRINLLNTPKAVRAFIYLGPRKFIRELFSKKSLNLVIGQLYDPGQSDEIKAFSAAFGIFMGIIPIWGLQTLTAVFLAMSLKLNKSLVLMFSLVSFPPVMPLIIFLSYRAGQFWTTGKAPETAFTTNPSFQNIGKGFEQYIYGSVTLAIAGAVAIGLLTFLLLKSIKLFKQYRLTPVIKKT